MDYQTFLEASNKIEQEYEKDVIELANKYQENLEELLRKKEKKIQNLFEKFQESQKEQISE